MARACMKTEIVGVSDPGLALQGAAPQQQTIVLVEDDDFVRNVACEVLRFSGYEVLPAPNAAQAKRVFIDAQGRIALLLTDIMLPDRPGYELALELRSLQSTLKVILISGYPKGRVIAQSPENGFTYLEKPFPAEGLLQKVRLVLREERLAARDQLATGVAAGR
jgi:two-component system, cell cycle sensor histidine kinase and response regulator CckA